MRFYSDNPVRDADLHTAWQDRHYVPVCCHCDQPIEGEIYETHGLHLEVCEECYYKHYADDEDD